MLNAPLIRDELVKVEQRTRWQEAARARKARAATHDQAGRVEPVEAASDLTGLVERVIQNVWKRLGLPAREGGAPPLPASSGGLPPGCSRTACLGRVIVAMGPMMFLVAFSLGDVVLASPALFLILKLSGIGFLFWLAWQIASAGHSDATAERQPLGFVGAAAFQWINPKSPLHMLPDGSFACLEQS